MNSFERLNDQFYFGTKQVGLKELQLQFPNYMFFELQQVHGNRLVYAEGVTPRADAVWTDQKQSALIIKTADCMPVLVSHPKFICAIHAGWRGVLNEIVYKSLHELQSRFFNMDSALVQIGPHIQNFSFEIDDALLPQFEQLAQKYSVSSFAKKSESVAHKSHVDLATLVQAQLQRFEIPNSSIQISPIDTKTTPEYHSYRRDRAQSGRNLSFVARPK